MPKPDKRFAMMKKWISEIADKHFIINGEKIICNACRKEIHCERKSQLTQHKNTISHKKNSHENSTIVEYNVKCNNRNSLSEKKFYVDMCKAMVAANIPWKCLNNSVFKNFLQKYTSETIPDECTLRKSYLSDCYNEVIREIRADIGDNNIWVSVDETTDRAGRCIASLVVGKMCESEAAKPHLLSCQQLEKTNHATITRFLSAGIRKLWPDGGNDRVLLLVTVATPYMLKAGRQLQLFYPNMLHITCFAHSLHRMAEEIRLHFPVVDKLIDTIKEVFSKAPHRIECYKEFLPNVPLPPEPNLTRSGTWLEAAIFYAEHVRRIKEVIESFDETNICCVKLAQKVLRCETLFDDLDYITTNFWKLPVSVAKLETKGRSLHESVKLVTDITEELERVPGTCGEIIRNKWKKVLKINPGFDLLLKLNKTLYVSTIEGPDEIDARYWKKYTYAPIASCDVERTFPAYKLIVSETRHQFTVDDLEEIIVTYCNANYK